MAKSPEEMYQERVKRVLDAATGKVPDRVPIVGPYELFPYTYAGVSFKDVMNDYALANRACHKFLDDFQPDADFGPVLAYPAAPMEFLGVKWFKWAGHGLGDNIMYQFQEGEYMKGDEYDEFIFDPSHFMASKWLPRSFKALEGFSGFPPMRMMMWFGWTGLLPMFATPEMQQALQNAIEAGKQLGAWFASLGQYYGDIKQKGFPTAYGALSWPPFDIIGDTLRGTRGIMADMIRRPDKLHQALEIATKLCIDYGSAAAGADLPLAWVWMHKGSEGFMSDEQYATFYWPYLKRAIEGMVANGCIVVIYCEGDDTSRLKYFVDVPKNKVVYHFAVMDMPKAKEMLHGTAAISGNVPNRLLLTGTPDDVKTYCKQLIDTAGRDGGYIMDTSALLDEAKPENVRAMFDFTREYGVYR